MRKYICILLLICASIFILTSCNKDSDDSSVKYGTVTVTVNRWSYGTADDSKGSSEETKYLDPDKGTVLFKGYGSEISVVSISKDELVVGGDFIPEDESTNSDGYYETVIRKGEERIFTSNTLDAGATVIVNFEESN